MENNNPPPCFANLWGCFSKNSFPIRGVHIHRAPEPEEIRWKNVGFPNKTRYLRKGLLWIVAILLIAISLGISIGISRVKVSSSASFGISVVVTAVNVGIQLVIMLMSTLEN